MASGRKGCSSSPLLLEQEPVEWTQSPAMLGCRWLHGGVVAACSQADDASSVWELRLQTAPPTGDPRHWPLHRDLWAELNWCSWGTAKPTEAPEPGGEPYPSQLTAAGLDIALSQSLHWLSSSSAVSMLTFDVLQLWNRLVEMFLGNPDSGSKLIAAFVSQDQTAKAWSSA